MPSTNRRAAKKRPDERNDHFDCPGLVFDDQAEEERYKRYKHTCYRNLVFKALLAFCFGLFVAFLLKLG